MTVSPSPSELNRRIRAKLTEIGRQHPAAAAKVVEVIGLLDQLVVDEAPVWPAKMDAGTKSRKTPKTYRRERRGRQWFLAEHRAGGRQPFLVPAATLDHVTQAMAEAKSPLPFDRIHGRVKKLAGEDVPIYLCRTVMRFWLSQDPPLIRKAGREYCPVNTGRFASDARKAFNSLTELNNKV